MQGLRLTVLGLVVIISLYVGRCYYRYQRVQDPDASCHAILPLLKLYKPDIISERLQSPEEENAQAVLSENAFQDIKMFLDRIYKDISGFRVSKKEREQVATNSTRELTYGEITFDSLQHIFDELDITDDDVFYDLGSGVGKTVVHAVLTTPIKKAVGIELMPTRIVLARKAYERLVDEGVMPSGKQVAYRNENILDTSLDDATIVYMCSTCYSPDLMQGITDILAQLPQKNIRIISLKKLPQNDRFVLHKNYTLPTSWSKGSKIHVYRGRER